MHVSVVGNEAYLADHHQAMDTEQGIAEWWLMRLYVMVTVQLVHTALQHLTECGKIEKFGAAAHTRYGLKG
jgi:hypothetical protein